MKHERHIGHHTPGHLYEIPSDRDVPRRRQDFHWCVNLWRGSKHLLINYRPISPTCICSKIVEHTFFNRYVVTRKITKSLTKPIRIPEWTIFWDPTCWLNTEVALKHHFCRQIDTVVMDFNNAFDNVVRDWLLYKPNQYGVHRSTAKWIRDFLAGHNQKVILDCQGYQEVPVTSSIPQGSVLRPILFLIFVSDISHGLPEGSSLSFIGNIITLLP